MDAKSQLRGTLTSIGYLDEALTDLTAKTKALRTKCDDYELALRAICLGEEEDYPGSLAPASHLREIARKILQHYQR